MSLGWRSIISDRDRRRRVTRCIDRISRSLLSPSDEYRDAADPFLASGSAGVAMFFAYRFAATGNLDDSKTANTILFESLSSAVENSAMLGLLFGLTGVGWTASHLSHLISLDFDIEPLLDDIDRAVLHTLANAEELNLQCDLFGGLSGIGVYALERRHTANGVRCVQLIISLLERSAKRSLLGAYWKSPLRETSWASSDTPPTEYADLGMARGVPGAVAFLASATTCGFSAAMPLLDEAASWLAVQGLPHGSESRFAVGVEPGYIFPAAHTAWCYGDPGVASALLAAARALGNQEMETTAVDTALAAARRMPETVKAIDTGFCHGSAGLLHMFNRFYQNTGHAVFIKASYRWLDATLDAVGQVDGAIPLKFSWAREMIPLRGILRGEAGTALALLAASSAKAPEWDRAFFLSSACD
jgi:lantibiotic modifying enzyme